MLGHVRHTQIHDASPGHMGDIRSLRLGPQNAAPRRRGRPLGRGRPYRTVAQRRTELAFCCAEMAGRHGQQAVGHPGAAQRRAEAQRLGHRAARAEQAREGMPSSRMA